MTDYFCDRCVGTGGVHEMDCPDYVTPDPVDLFQRVFTVVEVAKILRVSKMSIYRLTTEGGDNPDIPYLRVGRSVRITEQALRTYLAGAA